MTSTTIMENFSKAFETSVLRNIAKTAGLLALGLGVLSWIWEYQQDQVFPLFQT